MSQAIGELGECCPCGGCRISKVTAYRWCPGVPPVPIWARGTEIVFGTGGVWDYPTMQMIQGFFLASIRPPEYESTLWDHPTAMDPVFGAGDIGITKRYRKATWTCTGTASGPGWTRIYDAERVWEWDADTSRIISRSHRCNDTITVDGVTTASDYLLTWGLNPDGTETGGESGTYHGAERPTIEGIPWMRDYFETWEPSGYIRATYSAGEDGVTIHFEQHAPASQLGEYDVTYHITLENPKTFDTCITEAETMLGLIDFEDVVQDVPFSWTTPEWDAVTSPLPTNRRVDIFWEGPFPAGANVPIPKQLHFRRMQAPSLDWPDDPHKIDPEYPQLERVINTLAPYYGQYGALLSTSKLLLDPNGTTTNFGICYVARENASPMPETEMWDNAGKNTAPTGALKCHAHIEDPPPPANVTVLDVGEKTYYEVHWLPDDYAWGVGTIYWGCTYPIRFVQPPIEVPSCCRPSDPPPPPPFDADATTIDADDPTRTADELAI